MPESTPLPRIFIADSVVGKIKMESLNYSRSGAGDRDQETGGILVGKRLADNSIVITTATGPGPNAAHYKYEFGLDADYANIELQRCIKKDPEVDFIGIWHKHPAGLIQPSNGDITSAYMLFRDPSYKNREIVNPIVVIEHEIPVIRCYYMSREDAHNKLGFRYGVHEQRPDSDSIFQQSPTQSSDGSNLNVPGRLADECERLHSYTYTLVQVEDVGWVFTIKLSCSVPTTLYVVLSANYPDVAPVIHIEQNNQELQARLAVLRNWQLHTWLIDVVKEADHLVCPSAGTVVPASRSIPAGPLRNKQFRVVFSKLFWVLLIGLIGVIVVRLRSRYFSKGF